MRLWPWTKQNVGRASEESAHALHEAHQVLRDAHVMREVAVERHQKAQEVASRLEETNKKNHFAEAVARSMRKT